MTRRRVAASFVTACVASACSSSAPASGSGFPECSASAQLRIQGTVRGTTIDISEATTGGGFVNFGNADFMTPFGMTPSDAGATVETLTLHWTGTVPDGSSAPATGTLTMTATDPLGAITLCAGSGSEIAFPPSAGPSAPSRLNFILADLTLGPGCTQSVSGELRGCWQSSR